MSTTVLDLLCRSESAGRSNRDIDRHPNKRYESTPEEFREIRRIQKKKVEHRRRSSISDKMMNLYRLTMDLIGKDIRPNVKLEKVDVLGTCYNVFEYIAAMISQQPELQAKLRRSTKKLRMQLRALSDQKRRSNVRKGSDMCKVNENRVAQFSWSDFPNGNSAFFPVPGASGTHPAAFGRLTTHSTPLIQGMYGGRPISKHESFDFNVCNNPPTPIHQHSISRLQPMCVHDVACLPCLSIDHRGFSRSHSPLTFQLDSGIDTITVHRSISCYESAHGPSDCYSHPTIWRPYLD